MWNKYMCVCASKRARLFSVCAVVNNCLSFVYDKGHGSLSRTWSLNVSWNSSSLLSLLVHTITRSLANCIWISMGNLKRNNYRSTFCRYIELKCAAYCFHWICSIIWPYNWIFNVKNRFSLNWIKYAREEENARTREGERDFCLAFITIIIKQNLDYDISKCQMKTKT